MNRPIHGDSSESAARQGLPIQRGGGARIPADSKNADSDSADLFFYDADSQCIVQASFFWVLSLDNHPDKKSDV